MQQHECYQSDPKTARFTVEQLHNLQDISIYVGGLCNFNCQYCDRDFVKKTGAQKLSFDQEIVDFIAEVYELGVKPMVSFHGGETLLYIDVIKKIIHGLNEKGLRERAHFFIQTNGSLILKNRDFFEKYKEQLYVSISYDFYFQKENRTEFDIHSTLAFLDDLNIPKQLQYVVPTNATNPFDVEVYSSIIRLYKKYRINSLNLILLRHRRGPDDFKTLIADPSIDLKKLFLGFIQFVQLLYVSGINLALDGHSKGIDKQYYSNHKQFVISPDGLIYPEYQFIEYKHPEFAIGQWRHPVQLNRTEFGKEAAESMRPECKVCPMSVVCGLRYYYAMFSIDPPAPQRCREFYSLLNLSLAHLFKLKKHRSLLESIGT
jgi:radical SAM protein with 4Fe4S-binding SPASM domain